LLALESKTGRFIDVTDQPLCRQHGNKTENKGGVRRATESSRNIARRSKNAQLQKAPARG
jgi:hypothetical protein